MSFYFFIFSILIIISSFFIVTSKNSITSVLYLIFVFILSSLCFLLLGAEFLSILLVIIYVGAISILFLFVIMMLNLRIVEVYNTLVTYFPIGCFLGIFFILEFVFIIKNDFNFFSLNYLNNDLLTSGVISYNLTSSYSNLYLLGDLLYNSYNLFLIIAGLILLLAMISSIVLTMNSDYYSVKSKKIKNYHFQKDIKTRISFWGLKKIYKR